MAEEETEMAASSGKVPGAEVVVCTDTDCPDELMTSLETVREIIYEEVYSKAGKDTKRRLNGKTIGIMSVTYQYGGEKQQIVAISGQGVDEWSGKPVKIGNKLFEPVVTRLEQERRNITWAPLTYEHREYDKLLPGEPILPAHRKAFADEYIMRLRNKVKALRQAQLNREQLASALKRAGHPRGSCTSEDFDDFVSYYERFSQNDEALKIACEVIRAVFQEPDMVEYLQPQVVQLIGDAMLKMVEAKSIVKIVRDVVGKHIMYTATDDKVLTVIRAICCILIYIGLGIMDPVAFIDKRVSDPRRHCRTLATLLLGDAAAAYREMANRILKGGREIVQDVVKEYITPVVVSESCYSLIHEALVRRFVEGASNPVKSSQTQAVNLLGDAVFKDLGTRIKKGIEEVFIRHIVAPLKVGKEGLIPIYIALGLIDPAQLTTLADVMTCDPVEYCRTQATSLLGEAAFREIQTRVRTDGVKIVQDIARCTLPDDLCCTLIFIAFGIMDPADPVVRTQATWLLGDTVFRKIKARINEGIDKVLTRYLKPLGIPEECLTTIGIALGVHDPPGSTALADMTVRCAEDNALKELRQICKVTKRRVTHIKWFSATLDLSRSAPSLPLTHKPLCPFCVVAFEGRAKRINIMAS